MDNRPIGILDSGLGGLTIYQAVNRLLPQESIIYLADHKYFPYGDKSVQQINRRLTKLVDYLVAQNCKLIIIACNTITTNSIKFLRSLYPVPFIGTEPAIKPAIEENLHENILVLATQATAKSRSFKKLIDKFDQKGQVVIHPCPGLVEVIENSPTPIITRQLKKIINQLEPNYSAVILGCTHYILIKDLFKKLLPLHILVFEPSQAIARQTEKVLEQQNLLASKKEKQTVFLTTALSPSISKTASKFLSQRIIFKACSL